MTDHPKSFAFHVLVAALLPIAVGTAQAEAGAPTHEKVAVIEFGTGAERIALHTFCLDREGNILAACTSAEGNGEVLQISTEGERLATWSVDFAPQAVNVAPDGQVYVGGEGRFVALDAEGNVQHSGQLPQLADPEQARHDALEQAKKTQKAIQTANQRSLDRYLEQRKTHAAIPENERDEAWKIKQEMLELRIAAAEQRAAARGGINLEAMARSALSRKFKITAIAVSEGDVFVAAGARKGSGYELWRMNRSFGAAKSILEGMRGCCGQCDVQVHGEDILFADNCQHRVARYDREGELVGTFGKRARDGDDGFGGCCNPMNTRVDSKGRIFTAESEGLVTCFSAKGKKLATIASLGFGGGCKHIAVAFAENTGNVFLLENNKGRIVVLSPKERTGAGEEAPR